MFLKRIIGADVYFQREQFFFFVFALFHLSCTFVNLATKCKNYIVSFDCLKIDLFISVDLYFLFERIDPH